MTRQSHHDWLSILFIVATIAVVALVPLLDYTASAC